MFDRERNRYLIIDFQLSRHFPDWRTVPALIHPDSDTGMFVPERQQSYNPFLAEVYVIGYILESIYEDVPFLKVRHPFKFRVFY